MRTAIEPPEVLHFGLPRGEPPTRKSVIAQIAKLPVSTIEKMAMTPASEIATHRPPNGKAFDIEKWHHDLSDKVKGARGRLMIIDMRGLVLTKDQAKQIEDAIKKLPTK